MWKLLFTLPSKFNGSSKLEVTNHLMLLLVLLLISKQSICETRSTTRPGEAIPTEIERQRISNLFMAQQHCATSVNCNWDSWLSLSLIYSFRLHRVTSAALWKARRRTASARFQLSKEEWRIAEGGKSIDCISMQIRDENLNISFLLDFTASALSVELVPCLGNVFARGWSWFTINKWNVKFAVEASKFFD